MDLAEALLGLCCSVEAIRGAASRELDLTPQQAQLLSMVAPGELTHGELAARLHCDKTNVTGLVDRLQRRGLVRRRPDADDRRVARVALTEQGAELVARFRKSLGAAVAERLESWPPTQRDRLTELAHAATESLH